MISNSKRNRKIHFLGLSNGLRPLYILEESLRYSVIRESDIVFIGDSSEGCVIDFCRSHGIQYFIFDSIPSDSTADFLIVIGWSFFLTDDFLKHYRFALNCHGGLLPDYRGHNPYMHAYANMEEYFGPTIHFLTDKFDDGPIVTQMRLKLFPEDTPLIMHRRMSEASAALIPQAVLLVEDGYKGYPQKGVARYFKRINRDEMERIRLENERNISKNLPRIVCQCKTWTIE